MATKTSKTNAAAIAANNEKLQALDRALAALDKQFGRGTVMKLGEQAKMQVDVIPTGCIELDIALGVGGIPRGRIIEIFGPESSGKTTVALHLIAEAQKAINMLNMKMTMGIIFQMFMINFPRIKPDI